MNASPKDNRKRCRSSRPRVTRVTFFISTHAAILSLFLGLSACNSGIGFVGLAEAFVPPQGSIRPAAPNRAFNSPLFRNNLNGPTHGWVRWQRHVDGKHLSQSKHTRNSRLVSPTFMAVENSEGENPKSEDASHTTSANATSNEDMTGSSSPDPNVTSESSTTSNNITSAAIDAEIIAPNNERDDDKMKTDKEERKRKREHMRIRQAQLTQKASAYVSKLPLTDILRRLDKRGIRYAPSCSQEELEGMLIKALVQERSRSSRRTANAVATAKSRSKNVNKDERDRPIRERRRKRPQPEPETVYDQRRDRQRRQQKRRVQEEPSITKVIRDFGKVASNYVEPVDRLVSETLWDVGGEVTEKAKKVKQKAKTVSKRVVGATVDLAGNVVDGVGDVVGEVKDKATRRSSGKRNKRVIRVDENGIAEPDWSYVWQEDDLSNGKREDDENDYEANRQKEEYTERRRRRTHPSSSQQRNWSPPASPSQDIPADDNEDEFIWADYAIPFHTPAGPPRRKRPPQRRRMDQEPRSRRPRRPSQRGPQPWNENINGRVPPRRRPSQDSRHPQRSNESVFILPPASDGDAFVSAGNKTGVNATNGKASSRRRARGDGKERRIYSMYEPEDYDEGDVIDQYGRKIADAAENFLWGNDETGEEYNEEDVRRRSRRSRSPNDEYGDDPYENDLPRKRHWRDRLADRLDAAMGVHEQGSYYREWADRVEFEEDTKIGTDPEDWVMARHKNQRRMGLTPQERRSKRRPKQSATRRGKERGGVDQYFWSGSKDGNIMSVLLGRTPTGQQVSFDKLFDEPLGVNVITTLLKTTFQLIMALFSNACRWASVRGSLPQPIVVFFTAAAFVIAPKRRRFLSAGVTLFALRAMAEALHGYIYSNDGWEDDYDDLYNESDEEDDLSKDAPTPPPRRGRRRNSHTPQDFQID